MDDVAVLAQKRTEPVSEPGPIDPEIDRLDQLAEVLVGREGVVGQCRFRKDEGRCPIPFIDEASLTVRPPVVRPGLSNAGFPLENGRYEFPGRRLHRQRSVDDVKVCVQASEEDC